MHLEKKKQYASLFVGMQKDQHRAERHLDLTGLPLLLRVALGVHGLPEPIVQVRRQLRLELRRGKDAQHRGGAVVGHSFKMQGIGQRQ